MILYFPKLSFSLKLIPLSNSIYSNVEYVVYTVWQCHLWTNGLSELLLEIPPTLSLMKACKSMCSSVCNHSTKNKIKEAEKDNLYLKEASNSFYNLHL